MRGLETGWDDTTTAVRGWLLTPRSICQPLVVVAIIVRDAILSGRMAASLLAIIPAVGQEGGLISSCSASFLPTSCRHAPTDPRYLKVGSKDQANINFFSDTPSAQDILKASSTPPATTDTTPPAQLEAAIPSTLLLIPFRRSNILMPSRVLARLAATLSSRERGEHTSQREPHNVHL